MRSRRNKPLPSRASLKPSRPPLPSPPLLLLPPPKKPKSFPPSRLPGSTLPQAVVRYQGAIDNKHRPIYVKIVESLNGALASSPSHKHILVVGVKWTTGSNLVVRARAPSPSVLIAALKAVCGTLEDDHRLIRDIIPNTRWSRVTVSHVYSRKESSHSPHSPSALHAELAAQNPAYASLTIRQLPSWVRNPAAFKDGQISSVTFAFDDPDGSLSKKLIGSSFTAFGNLRCLIKPWTCNISTKRDAGEKAPGPSAPSTSLPTPHQASARLETPTGKIGRAHV